MLAIEGLRAGYGALEILFGTDLLVAPGEFVSLMGPNGAGKSTLLRTIFGMTAITGGSIVWNGERISGLKPRDILRRGIAFVPQGRCNFPLMSVDENLDMASCAVPGTKRSDRDAIFDLFPILRERRRYPAGYLSGGEQQMLEMGMAMLQRPRLLLIDEPSVGLSPQAIHQIFSEMLRINAGGCTVLLVEQNTRKAMEVSTRVAVLRLGQVIWTGPPSAITHEQLGSLFMTGHLDMAANGPALPTV
ncbi:MAG: ABC transporter ATP-binding protein [Rhodospirillales bacterium]|nr:ABC transporter ATP-binding protein [Rhodospirillales bacterium]